MLNYIEDLKVKELIPFFEKFFDVLREKYGDEFHEEIYDELMDTLKESVKVFKDHGIKKVSQTGYDKILDKWNRSWRRKRLDSSNMISALYLASKEILNNKPINGNNIKVKITVEIV